MARTPVTKPAPVDREWFDGPGGGADIEEPADALKATGYTGTPGPIPDLRDFNWMFRKADRGIRYLIERGLPDWDAAETYQTGDIVRFNGIFYACLNFAAPGDIGVTPDTTEFNISTTRKWERWLVSPFGGPSSDTTDKKIWTWRNRSGLAASEIDRLGYVNGDHALSWNETWDGFDSAAVTGTTIFAQTARRWISALTTNNTDGWTKIIDPSSTLPVRCLNLRLGTDGGDQNILRSPVLQRFDSSNQMAIDLRIRTGATLGNQRFVCGLSDGGNDFAASGAFVGGFLYYDVGTHFFFASGDGSALGTPVDTGITPAINTDYVVRIEWLGSGVSNDSTDQLRLYMNGTRVGRLTNSLTGHLPNAATTPNCCVMLGVQANGGSGGVRNSYISPLRWRSSY